MGCRPGPICIFSGWVQPLQIPTLGMPKWQKNVYFFKKIWNNSGYYSTILPELHCFLETNHRILCLRHRPRHENKSDENDDDARLIPGIFIGKVLNALLEMGGKCRQRPVGVHDPLRIQVQVKLSPPSVQAILLELIMYLRSKKIKNGTCFAIYQINTLVLSFCKKTRK